jgi:hypothetical protein
MNQHGAHASDVGRLKYPAHGVENQAGTEALAVPFIIYGKAGKDYDRHRMPGNAFLKAFRRIVMNDTAYRERMVAYDGLIGECDVGLGNSGALTGQGVELDKAVQSFIAAIKSRSVVGKLKLCDGTWAKAFEQNAFRSNKLWRATFANSCIKRYILHILSNDPL